MATIKTTAKRNPITGDPVPSPAYTKGKQSNFAGTDRKREPLTSGPGRGTTAPSPQSGGTIRGQVKTSKTNSSKNASKSRLERKMNKYGVEPASSKLSASQQKQFNKNRVKLAKEKLKAEKRQERIANPTKFDTFVMKTLHKGKYDRGSMDKFIVGEGSGGDPNAVKKDPSCKKAGK